MVSILDNVHATQVEFPQSIDANHHASTGLSQPLGGGKATMNPSMNRRPSAETVLAASSKVPWATQTQQGRWLFTALTGYDADANQ
jgi:hypothetical protein